MGTSSMATLLSLASVAERLSCSQRTVRRLVKSGLLKAIRLPGSAERALVRVTEEELRRFVQEAAESAAS